MGLASGLAPASMRTKRLLSVGNRRGDAGALDARQCPQLDRAGRDRRPGVSGADDRVGLALLYQVNRAADGRILLLAHGGDGLVAHFHDLAGVENLHARVDKAEPLEFALHRRSVTDQDTAWSGVGTPPARGQPPRQCYGGRNLPPIASSATLMVQTVRKSNARPQDAAAMPRTQSPRMRPVSRPRVLPVKPPRSLLSGLDGQHCRPL